MDVKDKSFFYFIEKNRQILTDFLNPLKSSQTIFAYSFISENYMRPIRMRSLSVPLNLKVKRSSERTSFHFWKKVLWHLKFYINKHLLKVLTTASFTNPNRYSVASLHIIMELAVAHLLCQKTTAVMKAAKYVVF